MNASAAPELKVAIFAQLLAGSAGGIETNVVELLRHLRRDATGVQPLVIGPGGSSDWLERHAGAGEVLRWPVIRYRLEDSAAACRRAALGRRLVLMLRRARLRRSEAAVGRGHHVASGRALSSTLRQRGIEVVHFPYQRYFETDLPFIFEPWDLQHIHLPGNFTVEELRFRDHLYQEACERADLIVTPTRWGRRDLAAHYGIDERKIAVIPRGPGELPRAPAATLPPLPGRYMVYPAKFWRHKNHVRLFEALGRLRAKGCRVPLVCTGEDLAAAPDELPGALSRHGVEDQVVFLGHLDRPSLTTVLARAELMVFPSTFEGLGIPVLEAFSLGVAVACARIRPLQEIAGEAVRYFDPEDAAGMADAIEALWTDTIARTTLGAAGRRQARLFRWDEAARDFVVCYRRLAGHASAEEHARFAALIAA